MASSANANSDKANGSEEIQPEPGSLAWIVLSIYNDLMQNALHDVVLQAHREEKSLRMQQLQLQAQIGMKALEQQQQQQRQASTDAGGGTGSPTPTATAPPKFPTSNEINPMTIIPKEIICPKCKNPRHMLETLQAERNGTLPLGPNGEKKKFCSKLPYQNITLHDIYGNPFPTVSASAKEKKAKAAAAALIAQQAQGTGDGADTPSTGDVTPPLRDYAGGQIGGNSTVTTAIPTGTQKKADAVIYFKCTNCSSEKIAAQRYAAHLEKCLGLAGRKSSRNAMVKMSGNGNGSGAGTPSVEVGMGKPSPSPEEADDRKGSFSGSLLGDTAEDLTSSMQIPSAISSISTDNTKGNPTPKKKKKKDGGTGGVGAGGKDGNKDKDAKLTKDQSSTATIKSETYKEGSPVITKAELNNSYKEARESSKDSSISSKKRKRKTDVEGSKPVVNGDEKEGSITVAKAKHPPPKKQKLIDAGEATTGTTDRATASPVLKKSQISKFKDRESPAPFGNGKKDKTRDGQTTPSTSPIISHSKLKKSASPAPSSLPPPPSSGSSTSSPKVTHAKIAKDGTKDRDKDNPGKKKSKDTTQNSHNHKPSTKPGTPKIAKKTLPGSSNNNTQSTTAPPTPLQPPNSNNSNNNNSTPQFSKIAGKSLPPKLSSSSSPSLSKKDRENSNTTKSSHSDVQPPKKYVNGSGTGKAKNNSGGNLNNGNTNTAGNNSNNKSSLNKLKSGSGNVGMGVNVPGNSLPGSGGTSNNMAGKTLPGKRAGSVGGGFGGEKDRDTGSEGGAIPRKKPKVVAD